MTNVPQQNGSAPPTVTVGRLPDLPVCGGPATLIVEMFADPARGVLRGSVSVCTGDEAYVMAALADAAIPAEVHAVAGIARCGDGRDHLADARLTGPVITDGAGQPAGVRIARAAMAREITRRSYAIDGRPALPAPSEIRFPGRAVNDLVAIIGLDTIEQAQAWAAAIGAARGASVRDTVGRTGNPERVYCAWALWRGWSVMVTATEPGDGARVPAEPAPAPMPAGAVVR
ncbi:hypothetical protein E1091_15755 [Micromonospora fluostatini]|uniref:Uncharacterized protein n=1 Tax=Micromonospora fluostatini TaxID=1629071 RepID=A0ABY2DDV1_9ACTN|nr:hypothetical protein E1091_15755 [Micromonospora fluostatini]